MPRLLPLVFFAAISAGCIHIDPIEVHAVVDVNVKVDKALDNFFGDIDKQSKTIATPPSASTP